MVVQGPPGTGKTHTIANIICHSLATGKRVLVVSKAAEPLVEVRDHIPEGIRDLVIGLLTTEREGLEQLKQAVRMLSDTAVQVNVAQLEREIAAGQRHVSELRRKIDKFDQELRTWANKHLTKITFGNAESEEGLIPAELAKRVVREKDQHVWLIDSLDLDTKFDPLFTDEDMAATRGSRKALGADLAYLGKVLPSMSDLPDARTVATLHQDLLGLENLVRRIAQEGLPAISLIARDAASRARALLTCIEQTIEFFDATADKPWLAQIFELWRRNGLHADDTRLFSELVPSMSVIAGGRMEMLRNAVSTPQAAHSHPNVDAAVERGGSGKRPFSAVSFFGKVEAKALVQQIYVRGRHPESTEDWQKVAAYFVWRREISEFIGKWTAITNEFGLPSLKDDGNRTGKWIADMLSLVNKAHQILEEYWPQIASEWKELFPWGMEATEIMASKANAEAAAEAIRLNLAIINLTRSRDARADLLKLLTLCSGAVVEQMSAFIEKDLGCTERIANQVSDRWQALCRELNRIHDLMPHLKGVERVADLIQQSGGTTWARQLRTQPCGHIDDPLTPGTWQESWQWARISGYLRRIDGRERIHEVSRLRLQCDNDLRKTFGEVVKLRTYRGLKRNLTDRIQAALVMFTRALSDLRSGKGIRAPRFRRDAREAIEKCYSAVPGWIMPTWRVSEHLPAEIGSFDLVIIDEASQSRIEALPALLRGKKVLIVGDDRQVSPTAAFIEERRILHLKHNYLKGQPFAPLLLPGSSLYDLASAVFPGTRIMLREHFRCVEPIIRFSFQFYPEPIVPLRISKPSERLDPPLIDIYLPLGLRTNAS